MWSGGLERELAEPEMGDEAETIVVSAAPKGRCRARVTVRDGDSLRPLKGAHVEVWSVDAGDTDASGVWKSRGFLPEPTT